MLHHLQQHEDSSADVVAWSCRDDVWFLKQKCRCWEAKNCL